MNHKEQHHRHEREQRKKHREQREKKAWPVHPLWLVILGVVLTFAAVLVWIFAF